MNRITVLILFCNFFVSFVKCDFPISQSHPILWTKSDKEFKYEDSIQSLTLSIENPCTFKAGIINGTESDFKVWCNKELEKKVFGPLIEMCDGNNARGSRKKRALPAILIKGLKYGIKAIGWIGKVVMGLSGSSKPNNDDKIIDLYNQINLYESRIKLSEMAIKRLESEVEENTDKIDLLHRQQEMHLHLTLKLAEYTEKLDKKLDENIERVESLEEWKSEIIQNLPSTITLVSKLTAYFEWCNKEIPEISRKWKLNQLNPNKFFTIFNLQDNDELVQSFSYAKPISCSINPLRKVAKFYFKYEHKKGSIQTYTSHPFKFIEMIPGSTLGYRFEYVGPKEVIYENESDCILPIMDNNNILYPSNANKCKVMPDSSVSKFWKKTCEQMHYVDLDDVLQIKRDEKDQYIYCYGFKIKIYNRNFTDCPPYVFLLKIGDKFEFDSTGDSDKQIDYQHLQLISKSIENLGFDTDYSFTQKINLHLMPNILKLNVKNDEDFPPSNSCPSGSTAIPIALSISGSISIIFLVGLIFRVYFIRRRRTTDNKTSQANPNTQNLNNQLYNKVHYKKTNTDLNESDEEEAAEVLDDEMKGKTLKNWSFKPVSERKRKFESP